MNPSKQTPAAVFKDEILYEISSSANVAQFVSFGPDLGKRFHLIRGAGEAMHQANALWIEALLKASSGHMVNVRTFRPDVSKATPFVRGLTNVDDVVASVSSLSESGFYTIVNETIDMSDGGTGGVVVGNLIEFAPCDTPRAVEASGVTSITRAAGARILEIVYGHSLPLQYDPTLRVEFTTHPMRCGYAKQNTIIWEIERVDRVVDAVSVSWPNRFSRFIGDKAFGLLVCDAFGLPVPRTVVVSRVLAPFVFGDTTRTGETWLRTCPKEPIPGRFSTVQRWTDPFALLKSEDPDGELIPSILAQEAVDPAYSGSLVADANGTLIIEGVKGTGVEFMLARQAPEPLPDFVVHSVRQLYASVAAVIGPASIEWVYDGQKTWLLQVHRGATASKGKVIVQGEVDEYRIFDANGGLELLRNLTASIDRSRTGIVVAGDVGVTSHIGDVLRQARVVSYIDPAAKP